ncbi:vitellogenin-1-like [Cimex lectularius]|uniref:Vitellogenin n=1 Tax=Cimex lectularius TaxID=79782 RepID=A0A8I6TLF2_CIMLE|nr:vitellogenin-1-like [Cimex lectularius]
MWSTVLLLTLVGVGSSVHAWKVDSQYKYEIRGRTVTGLHQVADQYAGMLMKGKLTVQPKSENVITLQIGQAQYADVHANLTGGWSSYIPDNKLNYRQLPFSNKPFELHLKNGVVDKMVVASSVATWELNMLKAIASQLQVDTQGEHLMKSKINQVPNKGDHMGVYKTMEDTVTGLCETIYDVSPLPEYVLQSRPYLAPLTHYRGDGQFIDIVKTMNYSNCDQRVAYHFGISGLTDWEPASNQMGTFMSRSSQTRVIVSGSLSHYTIQSSVTTNKIVLAPHLYNSQKGIVASRMNLTLEAVSQSGNVPSVPNPRTVKNLVYEYNAATEQEDKQNHNAYKVYNSREETSRPSSSSSSSSSSESSEHVQSPLKKATNPQQPKRNRSRRSVGQKERSGKTQHSSSSSSSSSSESQEVLGQMKKDQNKYYSSSSSSSSSESHSSISSSEEYWQPEPQLKNAPNSPFLPYFIGYQGNSIQAARQVDVVQQVQKLAQQIGSEVHKPNGLTGENTLSKFVILTRVLQTMTVDQLKRATEQLYYPYSKASPRSTSDAERYQAWVAFRDAMSQAGTGPALLCLKEWINTGKVQYEEAAELVAVLPQTARYPTNEYMNAFFDLATSEKVTKQRFLNTSAIFAFTSLVRKAQVDKATAHNRYPVHTYGQLALNNTKDVVDKYIPYLEKQLTKAISQGDSIKIQVYIRALGNTAHPKILSVFEPYLEGQKHVSTYQRLTMVASLDKMTRVYSKLARSVLFKIYQNTGDAPEVRVAAVMQLMKTNPPAQLLQRMAQFTNSDHSKQVIAAVQSAIKSAARLTTPEHYELAESAKSAVNLLNYRDFGVHYSTHYIRSYIVAQEQQHGHLSFKTDFTTIEGEDSLVPSSLFYNFRKNLGGFKQGQYHMSYMTSSADELMELLSNQFTCDHCRKSKSSHSKPDNTWSFEKIAKMLNVVVDKPEQVEGNLFLSTFGGKRFFPFDNHTVEQLPNIAKYVAQSVRQGQHFNFTKMYNQGGFKIGFPTAMGLPFVYTYDVPTLAYLGGEMRAQSHPDIASYPKNEIPVPKTVNVTTDIEFTYVVKTQGKMGFVTPFNNQRYIAGLQKNIHLHLPIRASVDVDIEHNKVWSKLESFEQNHKHKLFEYSTVAYTAKHDILTFTPVVDCPHAEHIHVRPVQRRETTIGQESTGFAFDVKAETEQKFYDFATVYNALKRHDPLSALVYGHFEQSINNNNFTVVYNPQRSTAQYANFTFVYGKTGHSAEKGVHSSHNKHRAANVRNSAAQSDSKPDSLERQAQFLQNAAAGIQDYTAHMVDMSVQFEGQSKAKYVATASYASSPVSDKSRFLFFVSKTPAKQTYTTKPYEAALELTATTPNVPLVNYKKAIETQPISQINGEFSFGEKASSGAKVSFQGKLSQTNERRDFVREHPVSKLCESEMREGNYIQPACRNATASANFFDQYKFTFHYDQVPQVFKNFTYKAYDLARSFAYPHVIEDFITPNNKENEVEFHVNFERDLKAANVSIHSPLFTAQFRHLPVNRWVRPVVVFHPEYNTADRLGQTYFRAQQFPTCVVDKNLATTFDNKSFPVKLGDCWHVLAHSLGVSAHDKEDKYFAALAREHESDKKELVLVFGENVVEVKPTSSSDKVGVVKVNGKTAEFTQTKVAKFEDNFGYTFFQVYALPTGAVRMYSPLVGVEVVYDGARVKLQVSNAFRGQLRGLCGTFNGEDFDDFTCPKNRILKDPYLFAASYALADETCQGPAKTLFQRAMKEKAYKKVISLGNVISEKEAGRKLQQQKTSVKNVEQTSTHRMIKIIERSGKTCFSMEKVTECKPGYNTSNYVEKEVNFFCPDKPTADRWVEVIKKGNKPDFSQKEVHHKEAVMVAKKCVKK